MVDDLDVGVIGDDPLVDGMVLPLRLRRDFTVTNASRLLTTARRLYLELNQDSSPDEAAEMVTGAADALFVLLEHAGMLGAVAYGHLAGYAANGLAVEGHVAQVVLNEPYPLSPHRGQLPAWRPHLRTAAERQRPVDQGVLICREERGRAHLPPSERLS